MNLDTRDKVYNNTTMLHSSDREKNFKDKSTNDWTGKDNMCFITSDFYIIADLSKDGFIHADGSLHF